MKAASIWEVWQATPAIVTLSQWITRRRGKGNSAVRANGIAKIVASRDHGVWIKLDGMTDQLEAVRTWLSHSGFPLEFETARAFGQAGFQVHQGLHYTDPRLDTKRREIDVLAIRESLTAKPRPVRVTALWVVECKARTAPWVVLRSDRPGGPWEALDQVPLHPLRTDHVLEVLDEDDQQPLLSVPDRAGFRVVAADPKGKSDEPYEAFAQVVSAARALVIDNQSMIPTIAFPTIVINAPLFSMHYSENGDTSLSESNWERVVWRGHPTGGATVVDVVTRTALPAFTNEVGTKALDLLDLLRRAWLSARVEILEAEHDRRESSQPSRAERFMGRILGR